MNQNVKHKFIKDRVEEVDTLYEVIGAGQTKLGSNAHSICGSRVGFSIGVSWPPHGIDCGGVLPRREAKKLADRIYELLAECENSEEVDYIKWRENFLRED